MACRCAPDTRTFEQKFSAFDFIAHVRVIKKESLDKSDTSLLTHPSYLKNYSKVFIEIVELYKGDKEQIILEWGVSSSCDMGISQNTEWVFFGKKGKKNMMQVGACTPSFAIKDYDYARIGGFYHSYQSLNKLRSMAGLPARLIPDGKIISYFPGGNISGVEQLYNGKLHGKQETFYPNGTVMQSAFYNNGVAQGKSLMYFNHGQLYYELEYQNGKLVHSVFWHDTSAFTRRMHLETEELADKDSILFRVQKKSETWTDTSDNSSHSVEYYFTGELQRESWGNGKRDSTHCVEYFKNAAIKSEMFYYKKGDVSVEKRWNESGELISYKTWEAGKFLGDKIKH